MLAAAALITGQILNRARWSFIQIDASGSGHRLMIPEIKQGLGYKPVVEYSFDLKTWIQANTAKWEPVQNVAVLDAEQSHRITRFHPVYIDAVENDCSMMFRLTMKRIED